jgi:branched-chain amino acid transport system ATP-binding protein
MSSRGYVMESGTVTLQGESANLLDDPQVRQAYLGE